MGAQLFNELPTRDTSLVAEVERVAEAMAAMLREKPVFFIDLVRAFPETSYRTLLLAWGEVRERHRLGRDEEGHYLLPPG